MKKLILVLICCSAIAVGCNGNSTNIISDNSTRAFVSNVENTLAKAEWIKPIADGVMSVFCASNVNSACVYYNIISKGANVAIETAKVAIAAYKKDPTYLNLANLKASMDQLTTALQGLDAGYKGKI